ncbi:MAG: ATP-binding protein, partial [Victivallaceae bacterium]
HEYCNDLGVEHHIVSLDMQQILMEKSAQKHPCVLCSRLRRGMLYKTAQEYQANKIALGHNLDDVAVSFLISLFRGQGLTTMGPNVPGDGGVCRVIRPLIASDEAWIRIVASEFGYPNAGKCHYEQQLAENGDRVYFGKLLAELEQRIPNIRRHILQSLSDVKVDFLLDLKFLTNLLRRTSKNA